MPGTGLVRSPVGPPRHEQGAAIAPEPTRARILANVIVYEAAWFACILGAANGQPAWGSAAAAAAVAWHVAISARPASELALVAAMCVLGLVAESIMASPGFIRYPSGQPVAWLAPYWLVALWGEFAIAPNVTLRWLKHRRVLAAVFGALCGPLSFLGGVRLGGASFVNEPAALASLAIEWSLLMPIVMTLSNRFDGVAVPAPHD